jgi:hypothetical protein
MQVRHTAALVKSLELSMKLKMNYLFSATVLMASALLSGCASSSNAGRFSWQDGWREGAVTAVGGGTGFAEKQSNNCKNVKSPLQQSGRYVTIMYRPITGRIWLTVPIPSEASLKPGDSVYFNVYDCSKPVERKSS